MAGWGNNTFGFLKWGTFGDEYVNVTNPNDSVWGQDSYGSSFWSGGGNLNADIGPVSITSEVNAGWGSDTWGYETWGISGLTVDLTGIELSLSLDSVTTKSDVDNLTVTGEEATVVAGTGTEAGTTVDADVTGIPLTATLQYQEAIVNPTGQELTANDGTANLDANTIAEVFATSAVTWGNSAWGYGVYGNQQVDTLTMSMQEGNVDPAPDAEVTGIAMAAVLDDVITLGDANTGVITDIAWGEQAWGDSTWGNGKYFDATGYAQAFTISLGTAELEAVTIAAVTGQELTMQEGDETTTGNALVTLTGNALTMDEGSLKTLIWNQVNTGTAPTWRPVDTAA